VNFVRRDDHPTSSDFVADQLGSQILAFRDKLHLGSDFTGSSGQQLSRHRKHPFYRTTNRLGCTITGKESQEP
jgi:hypothetical protein